MIAVILSFAIAAQTRELPVTGPNRPLPEGPLAGSPAGAIRQWYAVGRCIVKRDRPDALKMLATRPSSIQAMDAFFKAESHCIEQLGKDANVARGTDIARGVVVEALLLHDFSAIGRPVVAKLAKPFEPLLVSDKTAAGEAHIIAQLQVAECAVEAEPEKTFAVFRTEPASDAEIAAITAIAPAIGTCVPTGVSLSMRPVAFRTFLAEAAYRVSVRRAGEK